MTKHQSHLLRLFHVAWRLVASVTAALFLIQLTARAESSGANPAFAKRAERIYQDARAQFYKDNTNTELAIQFVRASFDWAEFAKNDDQREDIANEGIAVSRQLVARDPNSAAAHYYLGMNLAQLARTKTFGALKIVGEMERVFLTVLKLDPDYDYAGADRNLGLLYLEVPSFSIGDKKKARQHLEKAVERASDYPENRLLLLDAYIRLGDKKSAASQAETLETLWPEAKKKFSGEQWESSWADWETRFEKFKKKPNKK